MRRTVYGLYSVQMQWCFILISSLQTLAKLARLPVNMVSMTGCLDAGSPLTIHADKDNNFMPCLTNMPVTDIIKKRKSWRTYTGKPVEIEKKEKVLQFIANPKKPPFGSAARFEMVDLNLNFTGKVAGTYGVIKGAETFIAGIVGKGPGDMEDVGYLFERIILFATAIGLDT